MISNEAEVKCHIRKKELFDLLTKNINFNETKSICLFSLGSPYYAKRIEKEHPDIKITVVEDEEMKFLFCDMDNVIYANINKELWPKTMENVNFDCIIMNPPYSGNLHLKILQEAIKHADKTVNLSPVRWLQDPIAIYKKNSDYMRFKNIRDAMFCQPFIIEPIESKKLFDAALFVDLGIYTFDKTKENRWEETCSLQWMKKGENNKGIFNKMLPFIMEHNWKGRARAQDINSGITVKVNLLFGGHNNPYTLISGNHTLPYINGVNVKGQKYSDCAFKKSDVDQNKTSQTCVKFDTETEANNFIKTCRGVFMQYCNFLTKMDQHVNERFLPFMDEVVNPISGKKGYESEWTDEAFYKYFEITEEEQKIIEETMEKYK